MPEADGSAALLAVSDLSLSFGGLTALDAVSFTMARGETVGLIGPNGAGKSSLLNCINGFYRPQRGSVRFGSHELTKLPPHRIAELGVARTFQNVDLFRGMNVLENVLMGRHLRMKANLLSGGLYFGTARREERRNRDAAHAVLERLGLEQLAKTAASQLSVGTQKLVEFARALASEPQLVLLDEPVAGLSQEERGRIAAAIGTVQSDPNVTLVVIEHDMAFVRRVCRRLVVLNFGQKIAEGPVERVLVEPVVVEAFLGGSVGGSAIEQPAASPSRAASDASSSSPGAEPEGVTLAGPASPLDQV